MMKTKVNKTARLKKKPNKPPGVILGPKRSDLERKIDRKEMVRLMMKGWTQRMIAEQLGVSQGQISFDFRMVLKEINQHTTADAKEWVSLKLEEYAEIKREAWAEWERSKKDLERITNESFGSDKGDGWKEAKVREGRLAANGYLSTVLECLKAERDLLGLNPAKELSVKGQMVTSTVDWKVLAGGIPDDGEVSGEVEREIQRAIEAGPQLIYKGESEKEPPS